MLAESHKLPTGPQVSAEQILNSTDLRARLNALKIGS